MRPGIFAAIRWLVGQIGWRDSPCETSVITGDRVWGTPAGTGRLGLGRLELGGTGPGRTGRQHLVSTTEAVVGCHSLPGFSAAITPSDRQYRQTNGAFAEMP